MASPEVETTAALLAEIRAQNLSMGIVAVIKSNGRSFGNITTTSLLETVIRDSVYTEPTSQAQRSIVSNNLFDGPYFGTGLVKITYLDNLGNGPFTETLAPTGLTPANTVASNIRFIDKIEIVGPATNNPVGMYGTISLMSGINGTGTVIATISFASGGRTNWVHHYVPVGTSCIILDAFVGSTGNASSERSAFQIKSKAISGSNILEVPVCGGITLSGSNPTSTQRRFFSRNSVVGPARVSMYVTPGSTNSVNQRGEFSWNEY